MNILLGITGGIAAYKSAELVRLLQADGFSVRVVLTESAEAFVTPLTLSTLSKYPAYTESSRVTDRETHADIDHITLARWAELILIAPASADYIARLAQGRANDHLTMICLASQAPIAIAPAMNQQMWLNAATQNNIATLKQRSVLCWGPAEGEQACGELGPGRLLEPAALLQALRAQFYLPELVAKKILITAGPTREFIDPVRYLTNCSTGTMGYSLATAARLAGAVVHLVSGPTALTLPKQVKTTVVDTAQAMYEAVMVSIHSSDIFISAAAVSDYRAAVIAPEKIKKKQDHLRLTLLRNPDILAAVAALPEPPFTVGFSAETQQLLEQAQKKLREKNVDIMIANRVGWEEGFGDREIAVTLITKTGLEQPFPPQDKLVLARQIVRYIAQHFSAFDKNIHIT